MVPTILLVEDNDLVRQSIQDILRNFINCSIICAINGKEAMQILQRGARPNIIISDVEMPEMNGIELLAAIKQLKVDIPIIMMSGKNHFENQLIEAGAKAFLQKPVDIDVLLAMIQKYAK